MARDYEPTIVAGTDITDCTFPDTPADLMRLRREKQAFEIAMARAYLALQAYNTTSRSECPLTRDEVRAVLRPALGLESKP